MPYAFISRDKTVAASAIDLDLIEALKKAEGPKLVVSRRNSFGSIELSQTVYPNFLVSICKRVALRTSRFDSLIRKIFEHDKSS